MMKNTLQYLMMLCTVLLTSCNLFIDEDLERQLLEFDGKGYDAVVEDSTDLYQATYKFKKTTVNLTDGHPLLSHIIRTETDDESGRHTMYLDASTPEDIIPRYGNGIVSTLTDLFPFGLCDMVYLSEFVDGEWMVVSMNAPVQELFDDFNFHASIPFDEFVDEYDLYDDEDNLVAHVDRARNITRADEEAGHYLPIDIPFDPPRNFGQLQGFGDHAELALEGGLKGDLYCDVDFSWSDGFHFDLNLKNGEFKIGLKVKVTAGMDGPKKLLGNDDLLNGRFKFWVGPVLVVPVVGLSVNYEIKGEVDASIYYVKPFEFRVGFDGEDFYNEGKTEEGDFQDHFEASCTFSFPIVKVSIGFGIGTNDITYRLEIYITLETKADLASATVSLTKGQVVDMQLNPKLSMTLQFGAAVAMVAEGRIIKKILNKVKSYIKEKAAKIMPLKKAAQVAAKASAVDWSHWYHGELDQLSPEALNEINDELAKIPTGELGPEKMREMYMSHLTHQASTVPTNQQMDEAEEPHDPKDDEEAALRLGPFYPESLKIPILEKYLFPKMKEGSFRMGRNWDSKMENLVFTAEFILEDPGLLSLSTDFYPMFLIGLGSENILLEKANDGAKLNWNTPKGKKFTASFPGLSPDYTYTCRPGYAVAGREKPSIWDKPITFSTTTPSISIVDLQMTKNTRDPHYDDDGVLDYTIYSYAFDTYCNVKGSRNISEWGIIDLNDSNEKTAKHTSKSATLSSGQYIHHWSIKNTRRSSVKIGLQPYIFAKDADRSNIYNAKLFPIYQATIHDEYDFSTDARPLRPAPERFGFEPINVELDSVTCDGVRVL